jgi:hypothetical protein
MTWMGSLLSPKSSPSRAREPQTMNAARRASHADGPFVSPGIVLDDNDERTWDCPSGAGFWQAAWRSRLCSLRASRLRGEDSAPDWDSSGPTFCLTGPTFRRPALDRNDHPQSIDGVGKRAATPLSVAGCDVLVANWVWYDRNPVSCGVSREPPGISVRCRQTRASYWPAPTRIVPKKKWRWIPQKRSASRAKSR